MNDDLEKVLSALAALESAKELVEKRKKAVSDLLTEFQEKYPETKKKFKHKGRWYQIKKRGDRRFIIDFGDKEPGSWRKKAANKDES